MTIERLSRTSLWIEQSTTTTQSGGSPSLLPPPNAGAGDLGCASSELFVLISRRREHQAAGSRDEIAVAGRRAKECLAREQAAAAREKQKSADSGRGFFGSLGKIASDLVDDVVHLRLGDAMSNLGDNAEAAWNSPRFWKDLECGAMTVAKVAAVVGAACATVATFGAAGPAAVVVVAGVALSSAGFVESEFQVLEKLGVDPEVAGWVGAGLSIGGAVCGGAGGLMSAGSAASSGTALTRGFAAASTGASVAGGAARMVEGGAHAKNGAFAEDAAHAVADHRQAAQGRERIERMITTLIAALEENDKQAERTLGGLTEAMNIQSRTLVASVARG